MKRVLVLMALLLIVAMAFGCTEDNGIGGEGVTVNEETEPFVGKYWGGTNSNGEEVYWYFGDDQRLIYFNLDRANPRPEKNYEIVRENSTTYFKWRPVLNAPTMKDTVEYRQDKLRIEWNLEEIVHDLELISKEEFESAYERSQ